MKKILTAIALMLVVALCASFATSAVTLTALTSTSQKVTLNYTPADVDKVSVVYSVDITWSGIEFDYNAGSTQWNPKTHDYDAVKEEAGWSEAGKVTVVNHSNAKVAVSVAFDKADEANGTATVVVQTPTFTLDSAVDTPSTEAPTREVTLTPNGIPTSGADIGTVTVTIAAAE